MGPNQSGDKHKNADGYEAMVKQIQSQTEKPVIITEFGQFCCDTNGSCYDYNGTWDGQNLGYDEAIIKISQKYGVSWNPWSWRPQADGYEDNQCQDINGDGTGLKLVHPTDGKGADWATLWDTYANAKPDTAFTMWAQFLQ